MDVAVDVLEITGDTFKSHFAELKYFQHSHAFQYMMFLESQIRKASEVCNFLRSSSSNGL